MERQRIRRRCQKTLISSFIYGVVPTLLPLCCPVSCRSATRPGSPPTERVQSLAGTGPSSPPPTECVKSLAGHRPREPPSTVAVGSSCRSPGRRGPLPGSERPRRRSPDRRGLHQGRCRPLSRQYRSDRSQHPRDAAHSEADSARAFRGRCKPLSTAKSFKPPADSFRNASIGIHAYREPRRVAGVSTTIPPRRLPPDARFALTGAMRLDYRGFGLYLFCPWGGSFPPCGSRQRESEVPAIGSPARFMSRRALFTYASERSRISQRCGVGRKRPSALAPDPGERCPGLLELAFGASSSRVPPTSAGPSRPSACSSAPSALPHRISPEPLGDQSWAFLWLLALALPSPAALFAGPPTHRTTPRPHPPMPSSSLAAAGPAARAASARISRTASAPAPAHMSAWSSSARS